MKNTLKKISAFVMALTLLSSGTSITKLVAPQLADTSITVYAAANATDYYNHHSPTASDCLQRGSKNDKVKWMQCALNRLGYNAGTVDGDFGPTTEKAVKAFQKDNSLTVDGKFGKKSRSTMITLLKNNIYNKVTNKLKNMSPPPSKVGSADYIRICNAVAHEARSNKITKTNKAKVVEVIMNRLAFGGFGRNIRTVLINGFSGASGYVDLGTYSSEVNDNVKAAVNYYFSNRSNFKNGYLFFTGDGQQNHFRMNYYD